MIINLIRLTTSDDFSLERSKSRHECPVPLHVFDATVSYNMHIVDKFSRMGLSNVDPFKKRSYSSIE